MKKSLIFGMTTILSLASLAPSVDASEVTKNVISGAEENLPAKEVSNSVEEVEPYVYKDEQGFLHIDKSIPENLYIENNVAELEKRFDEINLQVEKGNMEINDDLSISSNMITTFASKGYTSKKFWWGERATYTNAQTKAAVKGVNTAAVDLGLAGALVFWLPIAAVPSALTSAYLYKLGNSMSNANKGKGVILDMTWALVYKTKSR